MENDQDIDALIAHSQDETAPTKTLQQLLEENPHHKGGLAQLAAAEQQAITRSTLSQLSSSMNASPSVADAAQK